MLVEQPRALIWALHDLISSRIELTRSYSQWFYVYSPCDWLIKDRPGAGPEVARPAVHPSLASISINNSGGTDGPLRRPRGVSEVSRRCHGGGGGCGGVGGDGRRRRGINSRSHEFGHNHSTAWRFIGQYLHWNPRIEELTWAYLRRAFGVAPGAPLPPPVDECFAPLSTYARRVEEVQEELQRTQGIEVQRVVLMSDETNETWGEEVAVYGWHRVDHSTTAACPREGGAKEVGGGEQRRAKPRLGREEASNEQHGGSLGGEVWCCTACRGRQAVLANAGSSARRAAGRPWFFMVRRRYMYEEETGKAAAARGGKRKEPRPGVPKQCH
ncbi:hypothetical protein B0H14DRAFT_2598145 [Mycena olivaceomarginata]|nr:hypothetical protein B0H14DRAFT_2598145 [Mycena olivaceomarginata]